MSAPTQRSLKSDLSECLVGGENSVSQQKEMDLNSFDEFSFYLYDFFFNFLHMHLNLILSSRICIKIFIADEERRTGSLFPKYRVAVRQAAEKQSSDVSSLTTLAGTIIFNFISISYTFHAYRAE